ncbi:5831_t:CDS:1 [Paraglomus occultum]|uniref:5831_t:CDS:1 n=1 Tax=Paraglomus occultum TaxID=144539 RepID=A0A9N9CGN8_9GLOM|nr:5831_t:CDS:1 [Paraglomus occultum]
MSDEFPCCDYLNDPIQDWMLSPPPSPPAVVEESESDIDIESTSDYGTDDGADAFEPYRIATDLLEDDAQVKLDSYDDSISSPSSGYFSDSNTCTTHEEIRNDNTTWSSKIAGEVCDLVSMEEEIVDDAYLRQENKVYMTRELLYAIKKQLDVNNAEHALFWCICTIAFHSLARINELVVDTESSSRQPLILRLEHVHVPKSCSIIPFVYISIPYSKNEYSQARHLLVRTTYTDTCPYTAFSHYMSKFRAKDNYATDAEALFCFEDGQIATRKWFTHMLKSNLTHGDALRYSFRAGGVKDMIDQGRTKAEIRSMGRWNNGTFEDYVDGHPSILVAFLSAAIKNEYEFSILIRFAQKAYG